MCCLSWVPYIYDLVWRSTSIMKRRIQIDYKSLTRTPSIISIKVRRTIADLWFLSYLLISGSFTDKPKTLLSYHLSILMQLPVFLKRQLSSDHLLIQCTLAKSYGNKIDLFSWYVNTLKNTLYNVLLDKDGQLPCAKPTCLIAFVYLIPRSSSIVFLLSASLLARSVFLLLFASLLYTALYTCIFAPEMVFHRLNNKLR